MQVDHRSVRFISLGADEINAAMPFCVTLSLHADLGQPRTPRWFKKETDETVENLFFPDEPDAALQVHSHLLLANSAKLFKHAHRRGNVSSALRGVNIS